ncbi:MAG: hypothetical protein MUF78_09415 [Candidatus Edwardsbacteria bacterium]|nr:hypothetical protein [Candidatus Edwardsbacteria bacterium]
MTHRITKDPAKGIVRVAKDDLVLHHDLWAASRDLAAELKGDVAPKVLLDLRTATIKVADWEKKAFAEAHRKIIGRRTKIAALVNTAGPQYREFLHFEILFANLGMRVRIFDDERKAERWLAQPAK